MVVVQVDFNSRHNFVSSKLLPSKDECVHEKIEAKVVPFHFDDFTHVQVNYEVPLILRGRNAKPTPMFPFAAYVISRERVPHFPYQRIILGAEFMERYAVSMFGTTDEGQIYFEDDHKTVYAQSFEKKRADSWAYPLKQ